MSMSRYNKSLDYTVLALAAAANGNHQEAGALLIKASKAADVGRAVQILEASNQQAYDAERRVIAKSKVKAAKRVQASKTQVKAFDIGDEEEIEGLINDEVEAGAEDFMEDDDDAEVDDGEFAAVLAGMKAQGRKAK